MDPVDELIWEQAPADARAVLVLDAPELVAPARARWPHVHCFTDLGAADPEGWIELLAPGPAERAALAAVDLVLLRLPKSLAALEEYAQRIACWCSPQVRVVTGGRVKHMTRGMNDVLGRPFETGYASLGARKSRVLHAAVPRETMIDFPRTRHDEDLGLTLAAHGNTFASTRVDPDTTAAFARAVYAAGGDLAKNESAERQWLPTIAKLSPDVAQNMPLPKYYDTLHADQYSRAVEILREQGLVKPDYKADDHIWKPTS